MAVVVQCYNCSNILELDEGFRGGVCRCSQCGSLLQVPKGSSSDMRKARPAAPGANVSTIQRPADPTADPGLSRGQFDPRSPARPAAPGDSGVARRVIDAGRSAGLSTARTSTAHPPTAAQRVVIKKNRTMLYAIIALMALIGVGVLVMLAVVIFKQTGQSTSPLSTGDNPAVQPDSTGGNPSHRGTPAQAGPMFLDNIPLTGPQIVFSIDGSNANAESFDFVRKGVGRAIASMTPEQRFVVAVWNDSGLKLFPATGWASKATWTNTEKDFENVGAYGSSDAAQCMVKSLQLKGDQTIFVTAKFNLAPDIATPVLAVRGSSQRIDAIKLTSEDADSPLDALVKAGGGKFVPKMEISTLESILNRE